MTTVKGKPRGYFEKVLALDCETTGLAYNSDDPSIENDGREYQSIAWGLVVADAKTLKPIEELYVEIKWDGKSEWNMRAQGVHGLSKEHLEENGMSSEDAVLAIGNLIMKYWGPEGNIRLLGHNVVTFDMWFLKRLMRAQGINLKFGNRHIDTCSIGFATFETFNSDDLFKAAGLPERDASKHNALDDAKYALESARRVKMIFQKGLNG